MLAVTAVLRLSAWALGNGDTGETATLSDARLCAVAWAESVESKKFGTPARTGALIRAALRRAGFLEDIRGVEGIHDFQEVYFEVLNKRRENRRLPKWTLSMIEAAQGRIVGGDPAPEPTPPIDGQAPFKGPTQVPTKAPTKAPQKGQPTAENGADSPGGRGDSRARHARPRDRAPESDPPVAGGPDQGAATGYVPQQAPQKLLNDVRGSGSGSGSDRGGDAEPPPRGASRPADPDPDREAAEAIADALNEDIDLVRQVLRELALKGIPANRAAQIALELPGPIGAWDFKAHALKVAQPPKPAAPDHGARPPSDGKALATAAAIANEAARLKAEFDASGYVDRCAWATDRRAGQVRTGPAAALRRFDVSTLAVVDVHPNAVGA